MSEPTPQQCGWCGAELPDDGSGRKYCSRSHKTRAAHRRNGRPTSHSLWKTVVSRLDRQSGASASTTEGCEAKTPFATPQAAERAIRSRSGIGTVYRCGDHWHITRQPLNARKDWRSAYQPPANNTRTTND